MNEGRRVRNAALLSRLLAPSYTYQTQQAGAEQPNGWGDVDL